MYRIYRYKLSNLSQVSREVDVNINCMSSRNFQISIHELNAKITRLFKG